MTMASTFQTFAEFEKAAITALADKPKGTGYQNASGVVLLLAGELCYVEALDGIEDCSQCDPSAFDEATSKHEWQCLQKPAFIARFTPAEVEAYEETLQ